MSLIKLIDAKKYDEAITQCKKLIQDGINTGDESTSLTGYVYLAIVYTRQNKFKKSRNIFDEYYLEITDECTSFWVGTELVNTYLTYGELKAPLNYLNEYIKHNPDDFKGLYLKGHVLYLRKEYDKALEVLQKAFQINKTNKGLLYNLAMVYQEIGNEEQAFRYFELAYEAGNNKAIEEIIKLLFNRKGFCDYENCENPCCTKVKLKGINALTITNKQGFKALVINNPQNNCWIKSGKTKKGHWVFECKNFGENNFCNDYENRPETCRDYPSSLIVKRACCSYNFEVKENSILFKSKATLTIVLDILENYKYQSAKEQLLLQNKVLLKS
ncbi:MAG: tetratricopeptide repeat protein [Chloroflexia bacterium]|nr:tetratricopeptide repeat protein [Chloroflexia bacterium]